MYNYLGVLRKSTAIEHCVSCNFFESKTPNLILSKNNRLEFYSLSNEGNLIAKKYINIYGKIKILLSVPSKKEKDNLFILSQDLNFSLFSFDSINNNINILLSGSIKEDLGKIQDEFLYCLDNNKNYLMLCAYKNIFKIICVNTDKCQFDKFKNYTIRFQYEKILFISPFNFDIKNNKESNDEEDNNILNYLIVKQTFIEKNVSNNEKIEFDKTIDLETIQIKLDHDYFNLPSTSNKTNADSNNKVSSLKVNSKLRKIINNIPDNKNKINSENGINNKNKSAYNNTNNENHTIIYNYEKLLDSVNFLDDLDVEEGQNINLIITHPDCFIIIFFSTYVIYYQYDKINKSLICSKSVKYNKTKFIDYITVEEKNYKYYIIDDLGSLYLFNFLQANNKIKDNKANTEMGLQFIGKVNPPSCIAYLNNNILFIGSTKSNSQLIKINENINNNDSNAEKMDIIEEYESLAPISNMILLNNTKEENGIEILTVSGIGNNCCVKNIKKGVSITYNGEIEIRNITQVFKIIINNTMNKRKIKNTNYCTFIITTTMKSIIINYDYKLKIISLNTSFNLEKYEIIKFAENVENIIIIVTNMFIYLYQNNSKLNLLSKLKINEKGEIPLILKYNKNIKSLFIFFNNNNLVKYNIDINSGKIIGNEIILNNISISAFDVCKNFLIFSVWNDSKLCVYSFNSKKVNYLDFIADSINFSFISSIKIIKLNKEYNIFLSLSIGKLIWLKLKKQVNVNVELKKEDFILKQNYNLNLENFHIKKIKTNTNKFLFLDISHPCLIYFNRDNLIISNFNANNCKNIIPLDYFEKNFLFVFNNKISFGSFSGSQNQNIYTLISEKQINCIKLVDFSKEDNNNKNINNFIQKKLILTIEETENIKSLKDSNEININKNIQNYICLFLSYLSHS